MEGVDRVRKAGWLPAPITPVPDLKGPLFCSPHIKKARADAKVSKLDVLMALLKPKDGWIDAMEASVQKHGRPARRQRPSHLESGLRSHCFCVATYAPGRLVAKSLQSLTRLRSACGV